MQKNNHVITPSNIWPEFQIVFIKQVLEFKNRNTESKFPGSSEVFQKLVDL